MPGQLHEPTNVSDLYILIDADKHKKTAARKSLKHSDPGTTQLHAYYPGRSPIVEPGLKKLLIIYRLRARTQSKAELIMPRSGAGLMIAPAMEDRIIF